MGLGLLLLWGTALADPAPREQNKGVFYFYQTYISPIDGDRCPMYPSCSAYAKQCLEKHGKAMGWIMTMDRLVRCGRDEGKEAQTVYPNGQPHIYDPVEANDFWWSVK
ncbi:MAG: membrane protein insertion efficiency factor YidD [Desulfobacterales bacterium]|nr:membrane protein insertion efficiency factor YidD [Desulfobacterales bacterium]